MIKNLILVPALLALATTAYAQPSVGCNDKALRIQAEQYKLDFKNQGLVTYRDAMVGMESQQPYPIAVHLTKGQLYQFIFLGSRNSSKIELELFDGADKQIDSKVNGAPAQNNAIIYSFIPEKTDMYLVVLKQKLKNKDMCGSFTIMQKGEQVPVTAEPTTPAKPSKK